MGPGTARIIAHAVRNPDTPKEGRIVSPSTEHIRSLALAGHAGAGKTTLFEAMLHAGGALTGMGSVERGSTVSDTDPMEKARGHSIDASIASIDRNGYRIHLLDTPGYADFRGPALAALAAADTVAIVVNAANGIEHGTRSMMVHAKQRGIARLVVVNRIDAEGVDLAALVDDLREEFGNECLPLNLPASKGHSVRDAFFQTAGDTDFSSPGEAHQRIIDQVVEIDDDVMEHYLEVRRIRLVGGGDPRRARTLPARRAPRAHRVHQRARRRGRRRVTGSGRKDPALPQRDEPAPFLDANDKPFDVTADPARHVIADVFKIVNDPFVGKLGVFRVLARPRAQGFVAVRRRRAQAVQGGPICSG